MTDRVRSAGVAAVDPSATLEARAESYFKERNDQAAIKDCTLAIERDPSLEEAWNIRGICQHRLGNLAESIADHTKAIELDPDNHILIANRGYPRLVAGRCAVSGRPARGGDQVAH